MTDTAAGPPRSPAEAVALGKRLADEGHAVGWPAAGQCDARLSLILPGDDDPEVDERCEKQAGHRDYHGTLSGYGWETSNSDRHTR